MLVVIGGIPYNRPVPSGFVTASASYYWLEKPAIDLGRRLITPR
jgi:hypothetical protein